MFGTEQGVCNRFARAFPPKQCFESSDSEPEQLSFELTAAKEALKLAIKLRGAAESADPCIQFHICQILILYILTNISMIAAIGGC